MLTISDPEHQSCTVDAGPISFQPGGPVILSVIGLFPATRQRGELVEILHSVADLTKPAAGCRGCWISDEESLHNCIQYVELWEAEDTLYEHIRSELYLRLLAAMEI